MIYWLGDEGNDPSEGALIDWFQKNYPAEAREIEHVIEEDVMTGNNFPPDIVAANRIACEADFFPDHAMTIVVPIRRYPTKLHVRCQCGHRGSSRRSSTGRSN